MKGFDGEAVVVQYLNTLLPDVKAIEEVNNTTNTLTYIDDDGVIKTWKYNYDSTNISSYDNTIYHIVNGSYSKLNYWYKDSIKDPMLKHIANRSPHLIEYLELSLGIELPEDAEVWSKLPLEKYIN